MVSFQSTLSSKENRAALHLSAQLSCVSQHLSVTRKTERARTEVVCSRLAQAFKAAKKSHRMKVKTAGA